MKITREMISLCEVERHHGALTLMTFKDYLMLYGEEIEDYYEGEEFSYEFHFNSSQHEGNSLVVTYDDADGFIGNIEDAFIDEQ